MTIKEQRQYYDQHLKVVPIRGRNESEGKRNQKLIKTFSSRHLGLARFLKEDAWADDEQGIRKVYLILEKVKQKPRIKDGVPAPKAKYKWELKGYFALSCGMVYRPNDHKDEELPPEQETIVEGYVKAMDIGGGYLGLIEAYIRRLFPAQGEKLIKIAEARHDRRHTKETNSILVDSCYPAIELTHICKRKEAKEKSDSTQYILGFAPYVFWEKIVPIIREVAGLAGAQYVYLFAAEAAADNPHELFAETDMIKSGAKLKKGKRVFTAPSEKNKLIRLYKEDMSFELLKNVNVLKPAYDYSCFSMIQKIEDLDMNRRNFWARHSEDETEE